MLLVGRVVARGREAEQCRPEALAGRGKASMPEAPLWRGGIATNVPSVCVVKAANEMN
jgi:hypothetical protein